MARGAYIALLDHDDLIAPDALYYMAMALYRAKRQDMKPVMLYTDEDKYEVTVVIIHCHIEKAGLIWI